jgi:hypothetical protein
MYRRLDVVQRALAAAGIVDVRANVVVQISRMGLNALELEGICPLIDMLEPVKWYARLLGMDVLAARTSGMGESALSRPYDADTPLNRVIDIIPPESMAARRVAALLASNQDGETELELRELTYGWRRQRDWIVLLRDRHPAIAELEEVSETLFSLAQALDDFLDGGDRELDGGDRELKGGEREIPEHATEPHGELLVAVAHHVIEYIRGYPR